MNRALNKVFGGLGEEFIDEANAFSLQIMFVSEVKERMNNLRITQKYLSEKMGVSESFLSNVFSANKLLNLRHIAKLERILDIDAEIALFDGTNSRINTYREDIITNNTKCNFQSQCDDLPTNTRANKKNSKKNECGLAA